MLDSIIICLLYITGVKFLDQNTLVTTSIDQRIGMWQIVATPSQGSSLRLVSSFTHDVADVSSLELYHTRCVYVVKNAVVRSSEDVHAEFRETDVI